MDQIVNSFSLPAPGGWVLLVLSLDIIEVRGVIGVNAISFMMCSCLKQRYSDFMGIMCKVESNNESVCRIQSNYDINNGFLMVSEISFTSIALC